MSATSKTQVYNFPNNFELATKSLLKSAGLGDAFIQGDSGKLPQSRIEVMFQTGEPMNQSRRPNGDLVYDYFSAQLAVRIVTLRPQTQRSLLEGVSTLHEEFAARVRELFEERKTPAGEYQTVFTADVLPFYKVNKLRPQGEARDFDPHWMEDFTRLPFLIEFGIRSDAWPT